MTHEFQRPDGIKVTYRRMQFDFEQGFDRYWHGGSPFMSLFWTQLSTAFQPGEQFFIDSARALKGELKDPRLNEELSEFCKQEGHHTAQHLKFDRMNAAMGIDVDGCRKRYTRALDRTRKMVNPMEMLAVTCALEHFTAGFAERFFRSPEFSERADPKVTALWAWHAAEELEHKATCHDVYKAAGGGWFKRVLVMPGAWFLIMMISMVNTFALLWKDKKLFQVKDVAKGLWSLFGWKGLVSGMLPAFLQYYRFDFHPWQGDNSGDIARWKAENSRYIQMKPVRVRSTSPALPAPASAA